MGFFSWLSAKVSPTKVVKSVEVVASPALYNQHQRIGGSLTPEDVSSIMREADSGYIYRLVDLFNESRQKDCHLQSVLGTREMAVSQMRPVILPATPSAQDRKIADWCSEWIANFGTGDSRDSDGDEPKDLRTLIAHLQGGVTFGHATAETLYAKDGAYVIPIGAVPLSQRRFIFNLADGRLRFWDVQGSAPYPGTDLTATYPGKFIQFQPRVNGDVESREGLCRVLCWAALFRNWDMGDWMKLAEVAWKPWRIGSYNKAEVSGEDVQILQMAMQALTTSGVAWIPNSVSIAVEWPKSKGDAQHAVLASFLGKEMSKAVLGQTMSTEDGSSLGQAKVHNEVRHDVRDNDGCNISACLRRRLLAPAVRLNFGRDALIPLFSLQADEPVNLLEFSGSVLNFSKAGLAMPAKWVRGKVGIPEPEGDEELIEAPAPKAPTAKPTGKPGQEPSDAGEEDEAA